MLHPPRPMTQPAASAGTLRWTVVVGSLADVQGWVQVSGANPRWPSFDSGCGRTSRWWVFRPPLRPRCACRRFRPPRARLRVRVPPVPARPRPGVPRPRPGGGAAPQPPPWRAFARAACRPPPLPAPRPRRALPPPSLSRRPPAVRAPSRLPAPASALPAFPTTPTSKRLRPTSGAQGGVARAHGAQPQGGPDARHGHEASAMGAPASALETACASSGARKSQEFLRNGPRDGRRWPRPASKPPKKCPARLLLPRGGEEREGL